MTWSINQEILFLSAQKKISASHKMPSLQHRMAVSHRCLSRTRYVAGSKSRQDVEIF